MKFAALILLLGCSVSLAQTALKPGTSLRLGTQETPVPSSGGSAPAAPVALAATVTNGHSFTAAWQASAGATGYYIDAGDSGFSHFVTNDTYSFVYQNLDVGNVTSTNVFSTNMANGNIFQYRIRAYNGFGTSGNSSVISVTTLVVAPDPAIGAAYDNGDCTIYIEWTFYPISPLYDVMLELLADDGVTVVSTQYALASATSAYVTCPASADYYVRVTGRNDSVNESNSVNPATSDLITVTCP